MPDHGEHVAALFEAAMSLDPGHRSAFLDRACGDERSLRQEVEELLNADEVAGSFLRHPVFDLPTADDSHASQRTIGPYHLLESIGHGGMGEVWLAEQRQPVRRRVALKLIKVGMDTKEVVARFESERQALALMDHPAIARVFEAGSTAEGRPYFVMEYVAGIPITAYCDKHKLTVRQRMELFIQVCEGVQHAHQKAIIHRDLKPSNILVCEVDGKPMPRIIDFGVSKAISQTLTSATVYTQIGTLIGTLGYMSPEQADSGGENIDTRTDVYSLGAVLFELLAGTLPLDLDKLPYDQVLRRLREEDVPRPSTRLSALGDKATMTATNRAADLSSLSRLLHGDPDAIALKALEKDRARRYASASALAADIGRYLRNESVTAHPPGLMYGARKYIRRHRLGVATVAGGVLLLAAFAVYQSIQPARPPRVSSSTQLTFDGLTKEPPILTDGSRLYFKVSNPDSPYEVAVTGGEPARLAMPNMNPFHFWNLVAISMDGSELLLQTTQAYLWRGPLWVIPTVPGPGRRINDVISTDAAWFADGKRFVYASGRALYVAKSDGTDSSQFAKVNGTPSWMRWSPDGRLLRFTVTDPLKPNTTSLWEVRADGSGLHRLLAGWNNSPAECCGSWTRDGRYFVFQSTRNFRSDIWAIREKPGLLQKLDPTPLQLTSGPLSFKGPQPSYDSRKLFTIGVQRRGELLRYDTKSKQFMPYLSGISADTVDFSKDGQWITYVTVPDGALWRSKTDGTEKLQLTFPTTMTAYLPRWAPDGKRIAFQGLSPGESWSMYIVSADGGDLHKIRPWPGDPGWSPDGSSMVFSTAPLVFDAGASTRSTIQIMDLRSRQVSTLPDSEGFFAPRWSPDGRYIAALDADSNRLQLFDLSSRKWRELGGVEAAYPNWSRDSRYIYFRSRDRPPWFSRFRISDASLERIASLQEVRRTGVFGWTWVGLTPDDNPLILRDTGTEEIYALDVDLP
jgi:serine/threonine protein kinase/Tol biopolymer transport system component